MKTVDKIERFLNEENTFATKIDGKWVVKNYKPECTLKYLKDKYKKEFKKVKQPTIKQLENWNKEGHCKALDGCKVEPDGTCSHGFPSWLIAMGMI